MGKRYNVSDTEYIEVVPIEISHWRFHAGIAVNATRVVTADCNLDEWELVNDLGQALLEARPPKRETWLCRFWLAMEWIDIHIFRHKWLWFCDRASFGALYLECRHWYRPPPAEWYEQEEDTD